jgi:hypothetical protein
MDGGHPFSHRVQTDVIWSAWLGRRRVSDGHGTVGLPRPEGLASDRQVDTVGDLRRRRRYPVARRNCVHGVHEETLRARTNQYPDCLTVHDVDMAVMNQIMGCNEARAECTHVRFAPIRVPG